MGESCSAPVPWSLRLLLSPQLGPRSNKAINLASLAVGKYGAALQDDLRKKRRIKRRIGEPPTHPIIARPWMEPAQAGCTRVKCVNLVMCHRQPTSRSGWYRTITPLLVPMTLRPHRALKRRTEVDNTAMLFAHRDFSAGWAYSLATLGPGIRTAPRLGVPMSGLSRRRFVAFIVHICTDNRYPQIVRRKRGTLLLLFFLSFDLSDLLDLFGRTPRVDHTIGEALFLSIPSSLPAGDLEV